MHSLFAYLKNQATTVQYFFISYPRRVIRLFKHLCTLPILWQPAYKRPCYYRSQYVHHVWVFIAETLLLILDIIGVPDIATLVLHSIHPKNKPLNANQLEIVHTVFGNEIKLKYIITDHYGKLFDKNNVLAFVSFNVIHFNVNWTPDLLVHEATHVWQYQQFGSVYIVRALLGQRSEEGYYYGGDEGIQKWMDADRMYDINYEQQAEIFADYYEKYLGNRRNNQSFDDIAEENMHKLIQKLFDRKHA